MGKKLEFCQSGKVGTMNIVVTNCSTWLRSTNVVKTHQSWFTASWTKLTTSLTIF